MLTKLLALSASVAVASAQVVLKVGAILHSSGTGAKGRVAYETWANWVNAQTDLAYNVTLTIKDYTAGTYESDIGNFTATQDVIVMPYGSGTVLTGLGFLENSGFTGPVMVWGGASNTIFATGGLCDGKTYKCFGTLTVGSQYLESGLAAIDADWTGSAKLKVLLVENGNAFSKSLCTGAETVIAGLSKMEVLQKVTTAEKFNPTDTELGYITGNASSADVVAVCGHSGGFVEPVLTKILDMPNSTNVKAILSTNSLTPTVLSTVGDSKMNCVMMPTQWAEADVKDTIVGWNSADFMAATQGSSTTYHTASAGASAVMLSHAMAADSVVANLATTLAGLPATQTFYGQMDFTSTGACSSKPMFTEQKIGSDIKIVAPVANAETPMRFPMSDCGTATNDSSADSSATTAATNDSSADSSATTAAPMTSASGAHQISAVFGLALALVFQYLWA